MTDLSREAKVAAAQLKLKKFQQTKVNKPTSKSTNSQSSIPSATAVTYFNEDSNSSSAFGDVANKFPVASAAFHRFDQQAQQQPEQSLLGHASSASSDPSVKPPPSLADYFSAPSNGFTGAGFAPVCTGGPESLFYTPAANSSTSTTFSEVRPTLSQDENNTSVRDNPQVQQAYASATPASVTHTPATLNCHEATTCSVVPTTNTVLQIDKNEEAEQGPVLTNTEFNSENITPVEDEIFDNMPTATTEKIMQISRQLNGILETSEQLTCSIGSSTMLNDSIGLDASFSALDEQAPGPSSPSSVQNSFTTGGAMTRSDGFLNHAAAFQKRSTTPTSTHSASHASSYVRELEERNVELASLLEKRSRAHERALAKLTTIQEQSARVANQAANDRATMEAAAQRDLSKAQEQIRAHAQTIGALVAEKTELQTKVNHLERLAQQRAEEIENLNERMQTFRNNSMEMERTLASSKVELEKAQANNTELTYQLERVQSDVKRAKASRENLKAELEEAHSRLNSRSLEISQLEVSINDLRRQLELAQLGATENRSTLTATELNDEDDVGPKKDWLTERGELLQRIQDQEQSLSQASRDRERLESQYQTFVAQVEQQAAQLRSQLSDANRSNQEFQLAMETVRRQLREKEDELLTCRGDLEVARAQLTTASAPSTVVAESPRTQTATPPSTGPSNDAQLIELQQALNERVIEVDRLAQQVSDLSNQLEAARAALAEKDTLLADRDMVLATATSERTTLSRAMEQNRTLKEQLVELQDAFVQMSNKNVELTTTLRQEQQALKESNESQSDHRIQLEQLQAHCAKLEADYTSLHQSYEALRASHDSHSHQHTEDLVVAESVAHVESSKHEDHGARVSHNEEFEKLVQELQTSHRPKSETINQLSSRSEELDSVLHRMRLLLDWLQSQELSPQAAARLRSTYADQHTCPPVEQFAQMDRLVRTLIAQRDEEVATQARQNQEHLATIQRLPAVEEWETYQTAYKQLESKFVNCMEKISRMDEERARLESVNAQLEMEASTVGEYITLFTHRRAAAAKRARAREQLLRRLVHDRRRLRARLNTLLDTIFSNHRVEQVTENNVQSGDLLCTSKDELSKLLNDQESQTKFLTNFRQLLEEIGPSSDETESDSAFSLLNDEDAAEQLQQQADSSESTVTLIGRPDTVSQNNHESELRQLSVSPLEQLRKQALQHDCPHCQCCVGNLIEV